MSVEQSGPIHAALMADLKAAIAKHSHLSSEEMLAVVSQLVGNLVALQNQYKYTAAQVLTAVAGNIELGCQQAIAKLMTTTGKAN